MNHEERIDVIEMMWGVILSDGKVDDFEANLMRRICGLIYFPDKLSGEIRIRMEKEKNLR